MATFDDILNANVKVDNEEVELIIEDGTLINNDNKSSKTRDILFTFDETKPIEGNVAFDTIYYQDSSKIYTPNKKLGNYTLKNHQLTSLYHMIGLEKMLFDVKRIVKKSVYNEAVATYETEDETEDDVDDITDKITVDEKMEIVSTHFTNIGILSDKVGSGKSYCIMALLNEAKSIVNKQLPFRNIEYGSNELKMKDFKKLDTNILLVPHGLVGQWKKYLENSGLKFYTIQKAKDIFELADDKCVFKGSKFKMVATEDDVKVEDGDEDIDDEDIDNEEDETNSQSSKTSSKSTKSTKPKNTSKTKSTQKELPIKKKKVLITKKTKEQITEAEKELAEQDEPKTDKNENKIVNICKKLETEKKLLNAECTKVRRDLRLNQTNLNYTVQGSLERKQIGANIETLTKQYVDIKNKIEIIEDELKKNKTASGAINSMEIKKIHNCFEDASEIPKNLKEFVKNFSHLDKKKVERLDVILLSATFYNLFTLYLNRDKYTINRLIIDECNSIKGFRLVEIQCTFTWLITSSIKSMMTSGGYINKPLMTKFGYTINQRERCVNSTGFILNMIKELYENKKENYKLYLVNRPEYIEQSMSLPEIKILLVICKDSLNIQVLGGIVSHDVMQMLNAGDIDGIVAKLDVVVGDETNVIEMVTQKFQDELKVKQYALKVAIENPKYNPKNESIGIVNKRIAIVELKKKIACIEERVKNVENCPVCFDDFTNPAITPCCSNKFCFDCITMTLNSKSVCPNCKAELTIDKMIIISNKLKGQIMKDVKSGGKNDKKHVLPDTYDGKMEELLELSNHHSKYENMDKIFELNIDNVIKKYLIFTEYESTLNSKITTLLDKWGLKYGRIKGSGIMISNLVEQYKTGNINTLLINSKYFGSGMNLENTTDIIIIHKMQSDIEMQVIGRAQRFGRVGNLRVWKLYYQNENN